MEFRIPRAAGRTAPRISTPGPSRPADSTRSSYLGRRQDAHPVRIALARPTGTTTAAPAPPLGDYSGRMLRFPDLQEGPVKVKLLEIEKGFPNEYFEFVRRLTTRVHGKAVRIGEVVEQAVARQNQLYIGQASLGRPKHFLTRTKKPTFLTVIGDPDTPRTHNHPMIREILKEARERYPWCANLKQTPEFIQRLHKTLFREMVSEITFDRFFYRFALRHSTILDISEGASKFADGIHILTTQGDFPPYYRRILMKRIRHQVKERLIQEVARESLAPQTKNQAANFFSNTEILERISKATMLQFDHGQSRNEPAVAVLGVAEHEHDIYRNGAQHDLIPELRQHCAQALSTLGPTLIDIQIDEYGHGQVHCIPESLAGKDESAVARARQQIDHFIAGYMHVLSVSDIHFMTGTRTDKFLSTHRRVEVFESLLRRAIERRSTLVLNGDIFDGLRVGDIRAILRTPRYRELFLLLKQVRRVIYIPGNHDSIVLNSILGDEIDSFVMRLGSWDHRVRNTSKILGLGSRTVYVTCMAIDQLLSGIPALWRWLRGHKEKPPRYSEELQLELKKSFPNMRIAPYYIDFQRGLIFEHGDAAAQLNLPRAFVKFFVYPTRGLIWSKYFLDRLMTSKQSTIRWVRLFFCKKDFIRHPLNAWFSWDLDEGVEHFYYWLRTWVYPGPLLGGMDGLLDERIIHPATRILVLGEMAQWFSEGSQREWTFSNGHKHLEENKDEGPINRILHDVFTECNQDPVRRMDASHYVNTGNWSDHTFIDETIEAVWMSETKMRPLEPPKSTKVGVCASYPFGNPHDSQVVCFYRDKDFEQQIAALAP